jgi:hypothetical protein
MGASPICRQVAKGLAYRPTYTSFGAKVHKVSNSLPIDDTRRWRVGGHQDRLTLAHRGQKGANHGIAPPSIFPKCASEACTINRRPRQCPRS